LLRNKKNKENIAMKMSDKKREISGRTRRALSATIRLAIAAISAAPVLVLAQGQPPFVWAPKSYQYDTGLAPAVAVAGSVIVEVHQAGTGVDGLLYYHTGKIQQDGTVAWASSSFQYDSGSLPSVAVIGTNVIEVHQSEGSDLFCHQGKLQPDGTIKWRPGAFNYDLGAAPSVAVAGSTIVEIHQVYQGSGPLYYHTAELETNGDITWAPNSFSYGTAGMHPSVAVAGSTMLGVYRDGTGIGLFYYGAGEIQANGTVQMAPNLYPYDMGYQPSVAVSGPTIVEVHQGGTGVGPLYYHTGGLQSDGTVQFAPDSFTYDTGIMPRVAVSGATILEVHQIGAGVGPLYFHTAAY
jgi:hypothetical protein